jgi:fructokinase
VLNGAHAVAGEWGHNPLPRPLVDEIVDAPRCYCGKAGCIESWCSGPALAAQYRTRTGQVLSGAEIAKGTAAGDPDCAAVFEKFLDRFARALATVVNLIDPDAIVLGGGLSNIDALYGELPARVEHYAFTPEGPSLIVKNRHGDSSGVRGAAWLWPDTGA